MTSGVYSIDPMEFQGQRVLVTGGKEVAGLIVLPASLRSTARNP